MTRVFESKKVCATMFLLFAMSVAASKFAGGSLPSFGSNSVLAPDATIERAGGPFFPPDSDEPDASPNRS